MKKKNLRLLSLLLTMLLIVSVVMPVPASATPATQEQIKQQIIATYKKAKAHYGWDSFHGYCGALVNVQLYLMGITEQVLGVDGRDAYDAFKKLNVTSGGYAVNKYPAASYTLKSALNAITKNGTENAYNILVGFEKTPSVMGRRYGHAVVIHAIIDGTVYYVESYNLTIQGVYYPEGTPVAASIDEFVAFYALTTTQFDGVVHFGLKNYSDNCTFYSSNATGTVVSKGQLWSQPCESAVHVGSEALGSVKVGQQLHITGLYLNTEGQYWYEIDGGKGGYLPAQKLDILQLHFDDVTLTGSTAPTVLKQGSAFNVKGTVAARFNSLYSIRARVYTADGVQVINTSDPAQGKTYSLLHSKISSGLTFRLLSAGQYRYELAAIVANYYLEDGKLMTGWNTITLWSSDFAVVEGATKGYSVSFNTCGGTTSLNQTVISAGMSMGNLGVAQRPGYVFLGWFTEPDGGQRITSDYVPQGDMTLYAHWVSQEQLRNDWMASGNCWYLYSDGVSTMICMELEGTLYYFSSLEPMCQDWMVWTDAGMA